MINLTISNDEYLNDLMELVRPFETRTSDDLSIDVEYSDEKGGMKIRISSDALCGFVKNYAFNVVAKDELERKRIEKRYLGRKFALRLPYGYPSDQTLSRNSKRRKKIRKNRSRSV